MAEKKWRARPEYNVPTGEGDIAVADSFTELLVELEAKTPYSLVKEMESDDMVSIIISYCEDAD